MIVLPVRAPRRTDAETCEANGWTVGTILRGHERWSGDGRGVWTTVRITAIGESNVLARAIRSERTDPDGTITSTTELTRREGLWTFAHRDWEPVYRPGSSPLDGVGDQQ